MVVCVFVDFVSQSRSASSRYGVPINLLYGQGRIGGNLIDASPVQEVRTRRKVAIGTKINEYTYYQTLAFGLCEGEILSVIRIWADKKVIYDIRGLSGDPGEPLQTVVNLAKSGDTRLGGVSGGVGGQSSAFDFDFVVHTGTETQTPDSYLEEVHGAGNVPGHRGLAYIVFPDFPLHETGNRIPSFEFEVVKEAQTSNAWTYSDPIARDSDGSRHSLVADIFPDFERPYIYLRTCGYGS